MDRTELMPAHTRSRSSRQSRNVRALPDVVAFDIYGTVIDTNGMAAHLEKAFGTKAQEATRLWREKQLEFSFRRGLMREYVNFDVCTAQALTWVCERMGVHLEDNERRAVLDAYFRLPAFPDSNPALESLKDASYTLVVLTNGPEKSIRTLLRHAELVDYFEAIITVDKIKTFKPNPAVYELLVRSVGRPKDKVWLVSGNPWDVIGAKAYGLKSVWVQRDPARIFDPWEFVPDIIVPSLDKLRDELPQHKGDSPGLI
jgi:2-haloacid dehalogenase